MKFLVNFDHSIGLAPMEKEMEPTSTVEDLEVTIA